MAFAFDSSLASGRVASAAAPKKASGFFTRWFDALIQAREQSAARQVRRHMALLASDTARGAFDSRSLPFQVADSE